MEEIRPFGIESDGHSVVYTNVKCDICKRKAKYTTRITKIGVFICLQCTGEIEGVEKMECEPSIAVK